jgi:hypothetical protein
MTALIIGPLTLSQIEHAEWAISPMQDMAGDEDCWYGVDDLPSLDGKTLTFPTLAAVSDFLYRLEVHLPDIAADDGGAFRNASSVAAARRLCEAVRKAGGAELATLLETERLELEREIHELEAT